MTISTRSKSNKLLEPITEPTTSTPRPNLVELLPFSTADLGIESEEENIEMSSQTMSKVAQDRAIDQMDLLKRAKTLVADKLYLSTETFAFWDWLDEQLEARSEDNTKGIAQRYYLQSC